MSSVLYSSTNSVYKLCFIRQYSVTNCTCVQNETNGYRVFLFCSVTFFYHSYRIFQTISHNFLNHIAAMRH